MQHEWMSGVLAELDAGRLIGAIKLYREHTGASLKDSKDMIDALRETRLVPMPGLELSAFMASIHEAKLQLWRGDRIGAKQRCLAISASSAEEVDAALDAWEPQDPGAASRWSDASDGPNKAW